MVMPVKYFGKTFHKSFALFKNVVAGGYKLLVHYLQKMRVVTAGIGYHFQNRVTAVQYLIIAYHLVKVIMVSLRKHVVNKLAALLATFNNNAGIIGRDHYQGE